MAQKTDGQLTTEANIIRDETAVGANTALRVGTMLDNLIDSKINNDRVSDDTALGNDATLVPSQNAVKTYVDAFATGLLTDNGNYDPTITSEYPTSGNTLSGGAVQKGDIWYISSDGTMNGNAVLVGYSVRALVDNAGATTDANWSISNVGIGFVPENVANKSTDVSLGTSDVYYPSQNAVKSYVDSQVASAIPYTPENIANKNQDISVAPTSTVLYPSNKAVADFVASNISTPSLQDVVAVNPTATTPFGCAAPTGASITANSSSDPSAASIEAYTGAGGYVIITNENGNASSIRATNLTTFRTHQLPDASGILALQGSGWGLTGNAGTNALTDFVGTTDTVDLVLKTNNNERLRIENFTNDILTPSNIIINGDTGSNVTVNSTSAGTSKIGLTDSWKGYLLLSNGTASGVLRANNLTASRTLQLPDANGTLALQSYSIYTALLNFDGTTVSAIVLQNTLGVTLNWTNPTNGYFRGAAASGAPFTTNKTWISVPNYNNAGQPYIPTAQPRNAFPTTTIDILMYLHDGTLSGTPNVSNLPIEIRVYP